MTTVQVTRVGGVLHEVVDSYDDSPARVPPTFFDDRDWGWKSGACYAGDHRFDVQVEAGVAIAGDLLSITRPLHAREPCSSASHYRVVMRPDPRLPFALYHEKQRIMLASDVPGILRSLTWHINRTMIEKTCEGQVVVHAAAARRAGITVVLPGEPENGKTTTVAGLLREGYDYVTDEAVSIRPGRLSITPFPKALSLDAGAWTIFPECRPADAHPGVKQWYVPAARFGSRAVQEVIPPPRIIVFPKYVPGTETSCEPLSRATALQRLVQSTFHFEDHPARNLHVLAEVASSAITARLTIGSLDDAVLAVDRLVSETLMREL